MFIWKTESVIWDLPSKKPQAQTVGLNNKIFISHSSGGWQSKVRMSAWSDSWWGPSYWLADGCLFTVSSPGWGRLRSWQFSLLSIFVYVRKHLHFTVTVKILVAKWILGWWLFFLNSLNTRKECALASLSLFIRSLIPSRWPHLLWPDLNLIISK